MIGSGASHLFVSESVVKSHYWLVDSTDPMSIRLATSSEIVSHLMSTVPIVFYDLNGDAITQHITYWITTSLSYDIL